LMGEPAVAVAGDETDDKDGSEPGLITKGERGMRTPREITYYRG